jgi:hypothetical protein
MITVQQFREMLGKVAEGWTDEEVEARRDLHYRIATSVVNSILHSVGEGPSSSSSSSPFSHEGGPSPRSFLDELAARQEEQIRRSETANARLEGRHDL